MKLQGATASDKGHVRETNQDRAYYRGPIAVLADGMGGHKGGAEAAQLAIGEFEPVLEPPSADDLVTLVESANNNVHSQAGSDPELYGMGTTLVALTLHEDDTMTVVNVGDSRAYWLRGQHMGQVTDDHSLVEDLVRQGRLTPEEAAVHPQRNILTRALGIAPDVEVDRFAVEVRAGDRLLLCSDGLFNEVPEDEFKQILIDIKDPATAAQTLVEVTMGTPCRDNVTVAVVDIIEGTGELLVADQADETLDPVPLSDSSLDKTQTAPIPVTSSTVLADQPTADQNDAETTEMPQAGVELARRPDGSFGRTNQTQLAVDDDFDDDRGPIDYEAARRAAHERITRNRNATAGSTELVEEPDSVENATGSILDGPADDGVLNDGGVLRDGGVLSDGDVAVDSSNALADSDEAEHLNEGLIAHGVAPEKKRRWPLLVAPLIAIGLFVAGTFGAQAYADASYFVDESDDGLAIFQGRRGGFLWFNPVEVEKIPDRNIDNLSDGSVTSMQTNEFSSLEDARAAVAEFEDIETGTLVDGEGDTVPNESDSADDADDGSAGNVSTSEDEAPAADTDG